MQEDLHSLLMIVKHRYRLVVTDVMVHPCLKEDRKKFPTL